MSATLEAPIVVTAQANDAAPEPPRKRRKKRDASKSVAVIPTLPQARIADQDGTDRESGGDLERSDSSDLGGDLEVDMYADHPT